MKGMDAIGMAVIVVVAALILLVLSRTTSKTEGGINDLWNFGSFARDDLKAQSVKGACEQWLRGDVFDAKKILDGYQIPKATTPYGRPTECCWKQTGVTNPETSDQASLWDVATTALKNSRVTVEAGARSFIKCSAVCNAILNAYDVCQRRCPGQEERVVLTCLNKIIQATSDSCPPVLRTSITERELNVPGCS